MAIVRSKCDPRQAAGFTPEELARLDAMADEEITQAALSDPDNPPLTEEELGLIDDARFLRGVREATGLSQAAFAKTYHINVARLRDLEQGRTRPDSALKAYYQVIARRPDVVSACLAS